MSDPGKAVFLSYASQDAAAVMRVADALRAAGVEVWFDQNELVGGDAWDAKIRKQIAECALFVPVISANTQARLEGYFRVEWKLAARRTHAMATAKAFLLPVVIDDTRDAEAHVPDEFREVQWTRLPGGETPEKFCARVKRLLSGEGEPVGAALRRDSSETSRRKAAPTTGASPSRSWFVPTVLAAAVLVSLVLWRPWGTKQDLAPAAASASAAPISEARKLVAQARALFEDGDDSNHENFFLADDLLKKALAIDSTDGEVWAAQAELSTDLVMRSYDRSATRLQVLRTQAERAVKLAPASAEAQLAYAAYLTVASFLSPDGERFASEALDVMQKLKLTAVQQRRALRNRLMALVVLGRLDEGVAAIERESAATGGDPSLLAFAAGQFLFAGRYAEAEKAISRSLALRRLGRGQMQDVILKLTWQGDLDGAAASLAQWPSWLALEDRGAFLASQVWLWRREPDKAIAVLAPVARDFLNDSTFVGPKAVLVALAQEMAGNGQAARAAWEDTKRVAMRVASEQLADQRTLVWKAVAMARLGETAEAETIFRQLEQTKVLRSEFWSNAAPSALLRIALGHGDAVVAKFDQELRSNSVRTPAPTPRAALQLNPVFDSIRATPEFQKWLAAAPAPESRAASEAPVVVDQKSVAVLAFANLSDDKANEYFSDGISEELLNVLAKVPGLKVSARTSAFYFKGKEVPIPEIARQLGVAYVVEGSVRKAGDKVRITAQLIKAVDGFHVWSDTFTRDLKDIFAVQDEIAALIAQNLKLSMGLVVPAVRRPVNPAAHQLVLEGRHFWNLRTREGFDRAETAFAKAIELDPQFAQAYAGLADVRWVRTVYASYSGANFVLTADPGAASERAQALDPTLAEAYPAVGAKLHWTGRMGEAGQQFKKAIALNPNYALAHHWYSLVLEGQGRLDEALAEIEQAIQLDPLSVAALSTRGRFLLMAGRVPEALADAEKMQALRPGFFLYIGMRAQALLAAGRRDEALVAARAIVAEPDREMRYVSDALAVYVLRMLGHEAEAVAHVENLLPRLPADSYLRGVALAALDRWVEALPYLERTPPGMNEIFFWNPMWDRWRDDSRFTRLMTKLNCVEEYQVARATLARMQQATGAKK